MSTGAANVDRFSGKYVWTQGPASNPYPAPSGSSTTTNGADARRVRMHLTRVHTEIQYFRHVVNWADGRLWLSDESGDELDDYVKTLTKVLKAEKHYGTP